MANKIVMKVEYWEDDKLVSDHNGSFMTDNLTIVQIREIAKDAFRNSLSNVMTDLLTK